MAGKPGRSWACAPGGRSARKIVVDENVRPAWLASLDLDLHGYGEKWHRAKQLALEHPHLQATGWPYWRVVRQLFVELGGLPLCWEDDHGKPLPDGHPDKLPWNPWPWWLDPEQRVNGAAILLGVLHDRRQGVSDDLPIVVG